MDVILHVGDISYANGNPEVRACWCVVLVQDVVGCASPRYHGCQKVAACWTSLPPQQQIWDTFMHMIEPASRQVPYMVTVGNHEYCYSNKHHEGADPSGADEPFSPDWGNYGNDSGGECGVPFSKRFEMPAKGAPEDTNALDEDDWDEPPANRKPPQDNAPFWYAFDYGSVHFVSISTEHDLARKSKQHRWLKAHLARVDRCRTPWLVVLMHRPMYVVFPHKSNRIVADHLRNQLEDLFEHAKVDLVLSGHVHDYARTCNVLDKRCVHERDGGMSHITVGTAGHKLSDVEREQADWLEHAEMAFGYARLHVEGSQRLKFEFVATEDGKVLDYMVLENKRVEGRNCPSAYAAEA